MFSGPGLAVIGLLLLVAGPLGTRFGLWPFLVGFLVLGVSLLLGVAALVVSVTALVRGAGWASAVPALVVGLAIVAIPVVTVVSARGAPPINDITTDPDDPPPLVAALALRGESPEAAAYGGAGVASQQRAAYPDIQPLVLAAAADVVFDRAVSTAADRGWQVLAVDTAAGRIEAVDTTFWFGFQDDIVIRIRGEAAGTRVDVRSKSRVGRGDLGANARRIRGFLEALRNTTG
jgi:uncharacterized protein (DUF1499 family)